MEFTYPAKVSSVSKITECFSKKIKDYKISKKLCNEYLLLIEEVATKIIESSEPDSEITFEIKKRLGTISAKIKCPGKSVILDSESNTDYSGRIIKEYSEHLRQSYSFGINEVVFTTSFSSNEILLKNAVSIACALLISLLFRAILNSSQLMWLNENISQPITLIFVRCMQTVAVPVAFFSLATFVVNIRRSFDANNKTVRLCYKYLASSFIAIAIALAVWVLLKLIFPTVNLSSFGTDSNNFIGSSVKDVLSQFVSTNILEPFLLSNPIPMLVNALLTGLAASSVFGKSGQTVRKALQAINDLFSRMMNIIYGLIPFFLFVAVFGLVINFNSDILLFIVHELGAVFISILFLFVFYIIRLLVGKVKLSDFAKSYSDILIDNFKIASNIESYPYNKRILSRKMSLSREYLSEGLKLGILLNMDGNCLAVTVILLNLITAVGLNISILKCIGIAVVLILFSVGAPNQPGSFLLVMIILMSFVGISGELVGVMLILEAILSKFYSSINAIGDIITLAIEDEKQKRKLKNGCPR